ncbi:hypothetical protein CDIK_1853 [Cucumispora dikerogammari]|nr:hypothetical protein CDIK_1853 [Cucumispora dikerogammari]
MHTIINILCSTNHPIPDDKRCPFISKEPFLSSLSFPNGKKTDNFTFSSVDRYLALVFGFKYKIFKKNMQENLEKTTREKLKIAVSIKRYHKKCGVYSFYNFFHQPKKTTIKQGTILKNNFSLIVENYFDNQEKSETVGYCKLILISDPNTPISKANQTEKVFNSLLDFLGLEKWESHLESAFQFIITIYPEPGSEKQISVSISTKMFNFTFRSGRIYVNFVEGIKSDYILD